MKEQGGFMVYLTRSIIPVMLLTILIYGKLKGVRVYECFMEGVKDGLAITLKIFPYLLAMILAVTLFRESSAMEYLVKAVSPFSQLIGLPPEVVPLVMVKPLSGSGALGIFAEILRKYGADSYIGRTASTIMGSTETIFYTITVYFGAIGIRKIRHTLWAAVAAELTAVIVAVNIVKIMF
jgi:spore maturation protein B